MGGRMQLGLDKSIWETWRSKYLILQYHVDTPEIVYNSLL